MKREVYSPEESSLPAASNNGGHESNVVSFLERQKSQLEKKTKDALRARLEVHKQLCSELLGWTDDIFLEIPSNDDLYSEEQADDKDARQEREKIRTYATVLERHIRSIRDTEIPLLEKTLHEMDFWDNERRNSLEAEVDIIGSYFRIFYEKFVEIGNQMEKLRKPLS